MLRMLKQEGVVDISSSKRVLKVNKEQLMIPHVGKIGDFKIYKFYCF